MYQGIAGIEKCKNCVKTGIFHQKCETSKNPVKMAETLENQGFQWCRRPDLNRYVVANEGF